MNIDPFATLSDRVKRISVAEIEKCVKNAISQKISETAEDTLVCSIDKIDFQGDLVSLQLFLEIDHLKHKDQQQMCAHLLQI